jgi:hypothetical protein
MSKTLRQLERESGIDVYGLGLDRVKWEAAMTRLIALALEDANNQLQEIKNRINILEAERMEHAALIYSDKGYTLGTLADADAFAEKRRRITDLGDCV